MEMRLSISLRVSIDKDGANLNEICAAVRGSVMDELPAKVGEAIIQFQQEDLVRRLTGSDRCQKKGMGKHPNKASPDRLCRSRQFVRQGYRGKLRKIRTDVGVMHIALARVECVDCGKKFSPLLNLLELSPYTGHNTGLEQVVAEVVSKTSYQRGEDEIEARGSAPVPRNSSHRWVAQRRLPDGKPEGMLHAMADGTGFKKWPGERGDLRVVIGLDEHGKPRAMGTYAGQTWEQIGKDVRKKLRVGEPEQVQLKLLSMDGERGMDDHLAGIAEHAQRCLWHYPRDLGYAMWKDQAPLEERKDTCAKMAGLVGVEIPSTDWQAIREEDKHALGEQIAKSEEAIRSMAADFRTKGYCKAAAYIDNAVDKLFSHVHLWIETGIVSPKTTSILEGIMRELGRRVKKLGWNWSDAGIVRIARMILLQRYDAPQWEAYWKEALGLHGRCRIVIEQVRAEAA